MPFYTYLPDRLVTTAYPFLPCAHQLHTGGESKGRRIYPYSKLFWIWVSLGFIKNYTYQQFY